MGYLSGMFEIAYLDIQVNDASLFRVRSILQKANFKTHFETICLTCAYRMGMVPPGSNGVRCRFLADNKLPFLFLQIALAS